MRLVLIAVLVLASGCASLLPTHDVIRSLDQGDLDVVVTKGADRYPQLGRLAESHGVVLGLDSVIVGQKLETADDRRLISTIASYMLGEAMGKEWVARVEDQRVVYGQGQIVLIVHRGAASRFLVDLFGTISLYLPLRSAPGRIDGVEALSFDVRASNQPIELGRDGGVVSIFLELLPRNAIYSQNRPTFKRWEMACFGLDWSRGATPEARKKAVQDFLANTRAQVGSLVKLELRVDKHEDGTCSIALGSPNTIELVLPNELLAGDPGLDRAVKRLAEGHADTVGRRGDDLLIRVGSFFFHDDSTGPQPLEKARRAEVAPMKRFRIPPDQAASASPSATDK
jgi:hypothetical protein